MLEVSGFMSPEEPDWANVEETLQAIRAEEFPRLVELLPAMHDCDTGDEFEHGLDLLLEGLRARLSAARSSRKPAVVPPDAIG
jgi:hypothetical protein